MNYDEALKNIKTPSNLLKVTFSWGVNVILPWEDGIKLVNALKNAEVLANDYDPTKVQVLQFEANSITTAIISSDYVTKVKVAKLMGISYKELIENEEAAKCP